LWLLLRVTGEGTGEGGEVFADGGALFQRRVEGCVLQAGRSGDVRGEKGVLAGMCRLTILMVWVVDHADDAHMSFLDHQVESGPNVSMLAVAGWILVVSCVFADLGDVVMIAPASWHLESWDKISARKVPTGGATLV
jgi:hypothetical protein